MIRKDLKEITNTNTNRNMIKNDNTIHLPSLCIPRIANHITKEEIMHVFTKTQIGKIRRIDFVEKYNEKGEYVKKAFIHFTQWQDEKARERVLQGKQINIVYNDKEPWFWKCSSTFQKVERGF